MNSSSETIGVLLMAYGTPDSTEDVEPYYTDIRGGRQPTAAQLEELVARYRRIGGRTPLLEITHAQARALEAHLNAENIPARAYVGMKHWRPFIAEAAGEIVRDEIRQVVALPLAPHYSRFSTEGYFQRLNESLRSLHADPDVLYVAGWHAHPLFLDSIAERMETARRELGAGSWDDLQVVFSAHSLPERILQSHDPYPDELHETCQGVAARLGLERAAWRFAYQSAGRTGEKWLGPEILEVLDQIAAEGHRRVLIAPIGFVADHLEILYDIDIECADRARQLGLEMRRIESPNASPGFIAALTSIVREQLVLKR